MRVSMVQHAVGQGGLFSGSIEVTGRPFRWLYDCGSYQRDDLVREVGAVAQTGDVDLMFLSHLDSDHVNGIDLLLKQCQVREVVLPYLERETILAMVAQDAARGRLTGLFVDLATDILGWFRSRGVRTVTFVQAPEGDDDEGPTLPEAGGGGGGGSEGRVLGKWSETPKPVREQWLLQTAQKKQSLTVAKLQQVGPQAAILFAARYRSLNWMLAPYAHLPSQRRLKAFREALEEEYGSPLNVENILRQSSPVKSLDKLRSCYEAIWSDHNLVSMALYSGPFSESQFEVDIRSVAGYLDPVSHFLALSRPGWLLTGDAQLGGVTRPERFTRHYQQLAKFVRVLMLPHHGSVHSFSSSLLTAFPELTLSYAAAGLNNPYGHPHEGVRSAVSTFGSLGFHQVSEMRSSQLSMAVEDL